MIFVDTGAFFASKVKNDVNHQSAVKIEAQIRDGKFGKIVTTNYVLDELFTLFKARTSAEDAIKIGNAIRNSPNIRKVWILSALEAKSWEYFTNYRDKTYSFTDCTSFIVMQSLRIDTAFTYDSHFMQAGFKIIG